MVNYSLHFIGLHLNLLRNGKKLTETGIHCFAALTRGIFFNTRWRKFVSPCDHVISTMLKNATVRILSPSQPFLGSSRNAPLPKRLLLFESHCWRGVLRDDRLWKRLLGHPIPQALAALFFSFIIILNSILVQIFKRLFTVQISNAANREANIKQEIIMMAFTPIKCYGKYHRFCFLQKFNNQSRNNESHEKITPCKKCDGVVNFALPWNILEFLLRKSEVASWWRGYLYRFCYVMKDRVLWEGNIRQLSRWLLCNQLWAAEKWWRFSREV